MFWVAFGPNDSEEGPEEVETSSGFPSHVKWKGVSNWMSQPTLCRTQGKRMKAGCGEM